ncbi:MAG: sugar transferase, partial [Anaerolineales bacterium]|nr:sugar transferase [Anaerolineales bacterium]
IVSTGVLQHPWVQALSPTVGSRLPLVRLLWVLGAMTPTTILFLEAFGNYRPLLQQSLTRLVAGGLLAPFGGLSVLALILLALSEPSSGRLFIFTFAGLTSLGLAAYRLLLRGYYWRRQAAGYYTKNVVVAGSPAGIDWLICHLRDAALREYRLLGYLDTTPNGARPAGDLPSLGPVYDLGELLVHYPIKEVIVMHPAAGGVWLEQVIRDCQYFQVLLRIVPEALLLGEERDLKTLYRAEPLHLPAVTLRPPHLDSDALFFKRLFDFVVAGLLLALLSPVFLLVAAAIKLTTPDLPVLYPWRVVGQNGVEFTGYKFTTMQSGAEALKAELMDRNEMSGPVFKIKDDPRVTRLGRFLRKYSLNELPQLWSVLKGDMSLVGPRPAFRHELDRYELWHKRKLTVRPGITCLWQVRGRNQIADFDEWVKMDLEYIDNWSLWLDVKILIWTAWAVAAGTGS